MGVIKKNKKKVIIGMSGGVDSSVAAALLLEQGYNVIGVTMRMWTDESDHVENTDGCCSLSAVDDARRVANKLGIPHYVMNFKDLFKEKVVDYFIKDYLNGLTPNPCIACNKYLKFDALLNKAISMGVDYVATGHYATVNYDKESGRFLLKKSVTNKKDQTYALYNLTQEQLSHTLMPIGIYSKDEIRKKAQELDLLVANKPDSQEICFIPDNDYVKFILKHTDTKILSGNFVNSKGEILGKHKGIINYTIGQRKGLGITFGKPVFVIDINSEMNNIVLGDETEVFTDSLFAKDLNLISIPKIEKNIRVTAKVRYSAKEAWATVYPLDNDSVKVIFDEPQRAITPGQAVVFYNDSVVVGGATICRK